MIDHILDYWRSDASIFDNICTWRTIPARAAQYAPIPEDVPPGTKAALAATGIKALYTHQLAAYLSIQAGNHTLIVTGTASGKTWCYNLPVFSTLETHADATALYLYPTKALAQDQLSKISQFLQFADSSKDLNPPAKHLATSLAAIYDGDTPTSQRPAIRTHSRLILTNPDMLHTGILPHHTSWIRFLSSLQFVVIDEMHIYRGVFGSHLANVLRRLKRVCAHYGASPQFILTSATIGNPDQLAEKLIESSVDLINSDGSARGEQNFLIYNPPLLDRNLGVRKSVTQECIRLADDLLRDNVQTILFSRTRRTVELVLSLLREKNRNNLPGSAQENVLIRGYRSGYLPRQRRNIETGLQHGTVRAVVATTALELGIDIGGMEAALLIGYPGTIAGTWQQAGRAGRSDLPSLAILFTSADPLDQYFANHPDFLFQRPIEQAFIDADNLLILLDHLRCAAFELPFSAGESFGKVDQSLLDEILQYLKDEGVLHQSGDKFFWMADQYPAQSVSLRNASPGTILIQEINQGEFHTIGLVDPLSANWMVHPEAIYLHEGRIYLVDELDFEKKLAIVHAVNLDYFTEPHIETKVNLVSIILQARINGGEKYYGELRVTSQLMGYRKLLWQTNEHVGSGEVTLPPVSLETSGFWISISQESVNQLIEKGLWRDSPIDYGANWRVQRQLARQRDAFACQVCGKRETDREHDVHHKIPFRRFTSYLQANRLENLITVCHTCHKLIEVNVKLRSGLSGTAYLFGHLTPLFVMCDPRDLGVYYDSQSELAAGQPVIAVYDLIPAGIGLSEKLYSYMEDLVQKAIEVIQDCPCLDGCPACVGPGGEEGSGGKRESLEILRVISTHPT